MTASHNSKVLSFLKEEMLRMSKSKGDKGYINGYLIENPSSGKFVITVSTPKFYGAGLNVYDFLMAFTPFIKLDIETGVVGEEKFTKYTIES